MSSSLKLRFLKKQYEEELVGVPPRLPTDVEMWLVTLVSLWFFCGLFLDGWVHNHRPELESFFTPWHAVFYSGYLATAFSFFLIVYLSKRRRGGTFRENIPEGFGFGLFGTALFALGAIGDLIWHQIFGIEADIDALLSPTHLVLAVSMALIVSTGLRVWCRTTPPIGVPKFLTQLPMFFSAAFMVSLIWFMTQFSHFIVSRASGTPPQDYALSDQNIAISGYLFHSIVVLGFMLFITRRARIATGGLTFIFTFSMIAMALMRDGTVFIPATFVAGIVADILARTLHPFEMHRKDVRVFSFIVPAVFFTGYFLTLSVTTGIWWSVHLWVGSIVITGLAGLLMSFLLLPLQEWNER